MKKFLPFLIIIVNLLIVQNIHAQSATGSTNDASRSGENTNTATGRINQADVFIERMEAANMRAHRLYERLVTRFEKIKKINKRAARIERTLSSIERELKVISANIEIISASAAKLKSDEYSSSDYKIFRKTVSDTIRKLATVFSSEKNFVASMKKYPDINVTATENQ